MLCCLFTNTGHPCNFSYDASILTVDCARRDFHYTVILILQPPKRCINHIPVAKSTMPSIYKCSWNIIVTFCWFQLAKRFDRRQSWWKTKLNSWSVRRVFIWRRHFLLYTSCDGVLLSCVSFLKTSQNVCYSTWLRQNDITFPWYDFSPGKMEAWVSSKPLNKLTCIFVCQIFGLRRPGVLVYIK